MQQIYKDDMFMAIAITVGCLGSVPKKLPEELKQILFNDEKLKLLIPRMQKAAILGTVHICKTTMKMYRRALECSGWGSTKPLNHKTESTQHP